MIDTKLTKKGLFLSVLPLLSLILIVILWELSETPSGLIPAFLSLFSFIPASLTYFVFLLIRQDQLPKSDPAYTGCSRIVKGGVLAVGIGLSLIFLSVFLGTMLGELDFLVKGLMKISQLGFLIFLALPVVLPLSELVLYLTVHRGQR